MEKGIEVGKRLGERLGERSSIALRASQCVESRIKERVWMKGCR